MRLFAAHAQNQQELAHTGANDRDVKIFKLRMVNVLLLATVDCCWRLCTEHWAPNIPRIPVFNLFCQFFRPGDFPCFFNIQQPNPSIPNYVPWPCRGHLGRELFLLCLFDG